MITNAKDMNGDVISIRTRIKAWLNGQSYTAVITCASRATSGDVVAVVAIRDDDNNSPSGHPFTSDAVVVFRPRP